MKSVLFILAFIFTVTAFGQTKIIAYKSHSGQSKYFHKAFEHQLFDLPQSNFGHAPRRFIKNAQLDSVIFISPEKAIMVTSEYCKFEAFHPIIIDSTAPVINDQQLWKAGKDTVYHHELFSKKFALDSIKSVLKQEYHFKNDIDEVIFIGYENPEPVKDKKSKTKKKNNTSPLIISFDQFPPKSFLFLIAFVGAVFFYLLQERFKTKTVKTS